MLAITVFFIPSSVIVYFLRITAGLMLSMIVTVWLIERPPCGPLPNCMPAAS